MGDYERLIVGHPLYVDRLWERAAAGVDIERGVVLGVVLGACLRLTLGSDSLLVRGFGVIGAAGTLVEIVFWTSGLGSAIDLLTG